MNMKAMKAINSEKSEMDWLNLRLSSKRADAPSKRLTSRAAMLAAKLDIALHKSKEDTIYLPMKWFKEEGKPLDNDLIRQLRGVFNIQFHFKVNLKNETEYNVFEVSYSEVRI